MTWTKLRQLLLLTVGWVVLAAGTLLLPIPLPLPFPAGPVMVLIGFAILSTHSKVFRNGVRHARHRHLWLSRGFETFATRGPRSVKTMVHRTRPAVVERYVRRQARAPASEPAKRMAIPFERDFDAPYGELVRVTPLIARVLAPNPGPFTFKGTGVYIVGAGPEVAVIDPGPDLPEHVEALKRALAGKRLTHILVTHTHSDHSPAAAPLRQWSGAKTYAFGPHGSGRVDDGVKVEEGGDTGFVPDVRVQDGEAIAGGGFTFDCVYTPGHTSNHMCFALREEKALFTGDHVMGWSTTVVAPPDGDMAAYMASLRKLIARGDAILWPTHGGPVRDPKPFLQAYLDHRLAREAQILACVHDGLAAIPDMVARMYADVDKRLHPAAARSVEAHLIQLVAEGRLAMMDSHYKSVS